MSTFAVFGMTETYAKKASARKLLKMPVKIEDYNEKLASLTNDLMQSTRRVQLSDTYDAPQFAKEFIQELKRSGIAHRDLRIRARIKDANNSGKLVWKNYTP